MFVNLLDNAVDAVSPGGEVRVRRLEGKNVLVAVEDSGPGGGARFLVELPEDR